MLKSRIQDVESENSKFKDITATESISLKGYAPETTTGPFSDVHLRTRGNLIDSTIDRTETNISNVASFDDVLEATTSFDTDSNTAEDLTLSLSLFNIGKLALFLPKNQKTYIAFNVCSPHRYLSEVLYIFRFITAMS